MTKIRPLGNRVFLQFTKEPEPTPGTLILPDSLKGKERYLEVVAIGEEVKILKVGNKVILVKYAGQELAHADEKYIMVNEEEVVAVIETGR